MYEDDDIEKDVDPIKTDTDDDDEDKNPSKVDEPEELEEESFGENE